jgi:hypothetical protein
MKVLEEIKEKHVEVDGNFKKDLIKNSINFHFNYDV